MGCSSATLFTFHYISWIFVQWTCLVQQPADETKDKQSDDGSSEYFQRIQAAYAALAKAGLA